MHKGLSCHQRKLLGVAQAAYEVLLKRGEAGRRAPYSHRLALWAIHGFPPSGKRGPINTEELRRARASLCRSVARLEQRELLVRFHRGGRALTQEGHRIGLVEAPDFRTTVDARALCVLEMLGNPHEIAQREFDCTLDNLRAELLARHRAWPRTATPADES